MPTKSSSSATKAATAAKTAPTTAKQPTIRLPELVEMLEAGVHFGHERSKQNPNMAPYIFMQRSRIAIFDLEKTLAGLKKAVEFLTKTAAKPGQTILFVGTKRQARDIVRRCAEAANQPYVTKRWLGGTLTNFSTILKSIEKLDELKSMEGTPAFAKLTKKEKAVRRKEIQRLEAVLEGIRDLRKLPAAVIVVGSHDEKLAAREARRIGLPVIGITDSNADPNLVDYPIAGNDDAVRSIDLLLTTLTNAILAGQGKTRPAPASQVSAPAGAAAPASD